MTQEEAGAVDRERAPRGRPKDLSKRQALIDAGRTLFIAHGFDAVTIDQVIAEARVSRATFYAHFHDKGALLEAMVAHESQRTGADVFAQEAIQADLEGALVGFGERLLRFLADPEMLSLERLIASAARGFPNLGRRLFAAGPGRGREALKRIVAVGQERGLLRPCDRDQAVWDLMGLWQGMMRVELNFGERAVPDAAELRARAQHGVAQFMKLYGTPPEPPN